jgi:uncharacterized protein involved in exopolysaccharide biosynthesis
MYERWLFVVLPLLIVPILVMFTSLFNEKQYVNHATILIEESALLNPFLDELDFSFELSQRMDALKTLVLSREELSKVITEVGLVKDPTNPAQMQGMQKRLSDSITISLVGEELVVIQFKWNKPEPMKQVLESLAEKFIERLLAPTKTSLDTSEVFLKTQLEDLRMQLETAEDKLARFKRDNRDALPELLNLNQDTLARLEQDKQQKVVELSGAKARLKTLKKQLSKANPVMGRLEDAIIRVEGEISLLRTRYTDQHTQVQAKLRELETLQLHKQEVQSQAQPFEQADIDSLWQIANSLPFSGNTKGSSLLVGQLITYEEAENYIAQLQDEIAMLEAQITIVTERLSSSSEIDKALRQLQRDYQVKQGLYNEMLQRYEMSRVTGQLVRFEGPDKVKTIERAYSPTLAINQSFVFTIIIGIVLGLFSSVTLIFISLVTDMRIRDISTIEAICEQPVLTKLPLLNNPS